MLWSPSEKNLCKVEGRQDVPGGLRHFFPETTKPQAPSLSLPVVLSLSTLVDHQVTSPRPGPPKKRPNQKLKTGNNQLCLFIILAIPVIDDDDSWYQKARQKAS
jgi:hypothetical protein